MKVKGGASVARLLSRTSKKGGVLASDIASHEISKCEEEIRTVGSREIVDC
jgi:hypothetical protein